MNKWTWAVLGIFFIWIIISSYWYVCGIKGFCQEVKTEMVADESISIGDIDDEVAERPEDAVVGGSVNTVETETTTRSETRVIQCSTYLNTYLRLGYANDASEMRKLEEFLNTYEGEELTVNGIFERVDEQAVSRFQEKYRSQVLTPWGLNESTGYVYQTTRDHINRIYCAQTATQ